MGKVWPIYGTEFGMMWRRYGENIGNILVKYVWDMRRILARHGGCGLDMFKITYLYCNCESVGVKKINSIPESQQLSHSVHGQELRVWHQRADGGPDLGRGGQ